MIDVCAISACGDISFRSRLCKSHYSEVSREVMGEQRAEAQAHSPPLLRSAMFLLNRMTDSMIESYRRVVELNPEESLEIQLEDARAHIRNGSAKRASAALDRTDGHGPASLEVKETLADLHAQEGRYEEALQIYRELQQEAVAPEDYCQKIGAALCGMGRHEEAIHPLEEAFRRDSERPTTSYQLGMAYESTGRYEDAVRAFSRAIEVSEDEPKFHQALGFSYEALERHDEALVCFKRALELEH